MATHPHQGPSILPQGASRPLSEEIKELPRQYLEVLTKPGVATFAVQMSKATWHIIWVQLLGWGAISTILGLLAQAIYMSLSYRLTGYLSSEAIQAFSAISASYGGIIGVPLGFFLWMGLVYLLARAFNGQGIFLTQSYTTLLFQGLCCKNLQRNRWAEGSPFSLKVVLVISTGRSHFFKAQMHSLEGVY